MRAAVIGAGRIGSLHARNLAQAEDVHQIIVIDANDGAARTLARSLDETFGTQADVATELDTVLETGVDLVVIAAPTPKHTALILQCVNAHVPVFCEKPGAVDLKEAGRLVAAVDASGVMVQIGFQRRFDPPIQAAAMARMRGDIGHLYLVRSATHDHEPPNISYVPPRESLFTETLIHDFDAIRFVTGQDVVRVMSMAASATPEQTGLHADVRHVGVLLQLSGGAQAVATAVWHDPCGYDVRMELLGSQDSVAVGYGDAPQLRRLDVADGDDPSARRIAGFIERFEVAYRDELEAFLDCVRTGMEPIVGVRDAYAALAIALAAWDSQRRGQPVDVAQLAASA